MNMKTTLKAVLVALVALALPKLAHAQQYTLGQTTLSAAVTNSQTYVQVASVTGINGYGPNLKPVPSSASSPQSNIYVDREQMLVLSISGTTLQVVRGVNGTTAHAHVSGQMVLSGPAVAFYTYDPGGTPGSGGGGTSGVGCTSTAVLSTPWLNVRTGAQWICSSLSSTWVPGFNNPAAYDAPVPTASHNSATAAMVVSGPLFHVTGTSSMTSITIPVGCNATTVGGCSFAVIPDGACGFTAGNNIAASTTCVANKTIYFVWDNVNSKFVASY